MTTPRPGHRPRRHLAAAGVALSALLVPALSPVLSPATSAHAAPGDGPADRPGNGPGHGHHHHGVGQAGVGDPYFPLAGNSGYDVKHYDLDLDYTPPEASPAPLEGRLEGVATIRLVATKSLRRFNLDLRGLTVDSVVVDGRRATFTRELDNELVITPARPLRKGARARVVVEYGGTTGRPTDIEDALYGWVTTRDGAMVVSEPDGSGTWFPVNDHPTDKATYSFDITVPQGLTAVANGLLAGSRTRHGRTTWSWRAPDPMAAYLSTATVGNFEMDRYRAPNGVPVLDFLDEDLTEANRARSEASLALTGEMMTLFEGAFGRYPFVSYGAIVDDDSVGYALETQTRSFFSRSAGEGTVAHELAHQWMGDHVSPRRWADIWLNEGWATYASWMWSESRGRTTAQQSYEAVLARPAEDPFWTTVVSDPGPLGLFAGAVYERGAATLHALRLAVGDEAFFRIAQTWVARYGGGTASTTDFRRVSERVSGQELDALFDAWLDAPVRPTAW